MVWFVSRSMDKGSKIKEGVKMELACMQKFVPLQKMRWGNARKIKR